MACMTLKRPPPIDWEWDPLQSSPSGSSASATTTTPTMGSPGHATVGGHLHSSPTSHVHGVHGHHFARPHKRLRAFKDQDDHSASLPPKDPSPFADVVPKMSTNEMVNAIKQEVRRFQNRGQLHLASQKKTPGGQGYESAHSSGQGPSDSMHSSDSNAMQSPTSQLLANYGLGLSSPTLRDQPLFTFRQVGLICERLLKEREQQIRQEYDQILAAKLSEQYDAFVKFTYDHVQRRFERESIPSYLS